MSDHVAVFAPGPQSPKDLDDPLISTRWIADQTHKVLAEQGVPTRPVHDEAATRAGLEASLTAEVGGVVFCSHGNRNAAILGADGPAFDRDNAALMANRWGHAIACHVGHELAARACEQGAVCFVGYEGSLIVEWDPAEIPADVKPLFSKLVTMTTCNLARGVRGERQLLRDIRKLADAIELWCQDNPERAQGLYLEVTATQLLDRLVYRSGSTR